MKVVWSRRAVRHLTRVRDYIAKDDPEAAGEVARQILESADRLAAHPHIARSGRIVGTRELVVSGTSYIVPYRIRGERLELIAVFPRPTEVAHQTNVATRQMSTIADMVSFAVERRRFIWNERTRPISRRIY